MTKDELLAECRRSLPGVPWVDYRAESEDGRIEVLRPVLGGFDVSMISDDVYANGPTVREAALALLALYEERVAYLRAALGEGR